MTRILHVKLAIGTADKSYSGRPWEVLSVEHAMDQIEYGGKWYSEPLGAFTTGPPYIQAGMRFRRLSKNSQRWHGMMSSPEVAKENKHQVRETEHLLKAILEQKNGLAQRIFSKDSVDNTRLLEATDKFIQRQPKIDKEYMSPHFVTNENNLSVEFEDAKVHQV